MKNERAIEELLAELLKTVDRQTEILNKHTDILDKHTDILATLSEGQLAQTKIADLLNTKIDLFREENNINSAHVSGGLSRIENELKLIRPLLEKALDMKG